MFYKAPIKKKKKIRVVNNDKPAPTRGKLLSKRKPYIYLNKCQTVWLKGFEIKKKNQKLFHLIKQCYARATTYTVIYVRCVYIYLTMSGAL